jgi:hypothetical protein
MAPTILLPVRSSLYAVLPSVGVALVAGEVVERIRARVAAAAWRRAALVIVSIFVLLQPVYRIRNARYVREAELSASIAAQLQNVALTLPQAGSLVVIEDVRDVRPTAEQALGALAERAAFLATNGRLRAWIDPPPQELAGTAPPDLRSAVATLSVQGGRVRRVN